MDTQVLRVQLKTTWRYDGHWAEKQAPEDRQATEDVLTPMTQYLVEEPREAFVEIRGRARATDNRVIASGDHVARTTWTHDIW